ncbi:hypothetical protein GCM10028784_30370 [Myceligenerans cantabricum]
MESAAGVTVVALFVLWLGYWAPHLIRDRTELAAARAGDRFSGGLRVVAVSGGTVFSTRPTGQERGGAMTTGTGGSRLTGARPAPLALDPEDMETPAQRRVLAVQRARRAVRARRRFVLTLFLLLASLAAWAAVVAVPLHWVVGVVPTAVLVTALVLGRRAAIRARRAEDAVEAGRRAARQRATQARALANGGPYAPRNRMRVTEATDEVVLATKKGGVLDELLTVPEPVRAKVVDESGAPAAERADDDGAGEESPGVGGGAWDPVPVPLPTYVTKPAAPRVTSGSVSARASDGARKSGAGGDGVRAGGAGAGKPATEGAGANRTDDASARLAAAMRASAGMSTGEKHVSEEPAGDEPAERARAASSDSAAHPDEEELMRPAPRVPDETLAQPLERILARRRAAG